eukprot:TRINITY_DN57746_c0_g1_i1.p1 TRINITY_DN57746_c0_g1~~TRINITY_DN57746_c0_g1_i1.p1  ORF type:complete len:472 (+),score=90.75 TRINITY_DN57746_c0_g1_i1:49-1464(+)
MWCRGSRSGALARQLVVNSRVGASSVAPLKKNFVRRFAAAAVDAGRKLGTVKLWNGDRGYGFILPAEEGPDVFVHRSAFADVRAEPLPGQAVRYLVEHNDRTNKYAAVNVVFTDTADGLDKDRNGSDEGRNATASSPEPAPRAVATAITAASASEQTGPATSLLTAPRLRHVQPLEVPTEATAEERTELIMAQLERLRLQQMESQQMLLQGLQAMLQQQAAQAAAQAASLERVIAAVSNESKEVEAARIGASAEVGAAVAAEGVESSVKVSPSRASTVKSVRDVPASMDVAPEDPTPTADAELDAPLDTDVSLPASNRENAAARSPAVVGSTAQRPDKDSVTASTSSPWDARAYHLVGSMSGWTINSGAMGPRGGRIVVRKNAPEVDDAFDPDARREEFQIVGDGVWDKRIYPAGSSEGEPVLLRSGQPAAVARGGSDDGHNRNFAVQGRARAAFRITYDPSAGTVMAELE